MVGDDPNVMANDMAVKGLTSIIIAESPTAATWHENGDRDPNPKSCTGRFGLVCINYHCT